MNEHQRYDSHVIQAEAPSPLLALARQVAREWAFVNELEVVEVLEGVTHGVTQLRFMFRTPRRNKFGIILPSESDTTRERLLEGLQYQWDEMRHREPSTTPRAR